MYSTSEGDFVLGFLSKVKSNICGMEGHATTCVRGVWVEGPVYASIRSSSTVLSLKYSGVDPLLIKLARLKRFYHHTGGSMNQEST